MNINKLHSIASNGDKNAERQLFQKLHERFRFIVQQKVVDRWDVEEIVQESLMAIARKYGNIDFKVSFSAWAYKVLENCILNYYRTKARRQSKMERISERQDSISDVPDPEVKRRLLDCLKKVNETNIRHARILNFSYQGYTIKQICNRLSITKNAAYILLSRARAMLKICMEKGIVKE